MDRSSLHPLKSPHRAVALMLASLAWAAMAQTTEPSATIKTTMEASFARADANSDGKLSREEAERLPAIANNFDQLDADHDSFLSLAEFAVGFNAAL